jgi:hypothetical protein
MKMKKTVFFLVPVVLMLLAISCDSESELETNYTDDEHYGRIIVHNEADSGKSITRIIIEHGRYGSYTKISEYSFNSYSSDDGDTWEPSFPPGRSSDEYKVELKWDAWLGILFNGYRVTVWLGDLSGNSSNEQKSRTISAYEDIVNNLYFDGTNLVERK